MPEHHRVKTKPSTMPRIDPERVKEALGAEDMPEGRRWVKRCLEKTEGQGLQCNLELGHEGFHRVDERPRVNPDEVVLKVTDLEKIQKAMRLSDELVKAQDAMQDTPDLLEETRGALAAAWRVIPT